MFIYLSGVTVRLQSLVYIYSSMSDSGVQSSSSWGLLNRKSKLSAQEDQEPFEEVVGRPSAAFYASMQMAKQRSQSSEEAKQWAMDHDHDDDVEEIKRKKVGKKTLLAAVFFVVTGLVGFLINLPV